MIVRWPSSHIINHYSLTYSLAQFINQPINGWVQRYVTPLNITFVTAGKLTGGFVCVLSEIRYIPVLYGIVNPKKCHVYILFTKLAPISPSELRFNSKAAFSFECILSFLLLFYHTLTCRCLPCPVVSTCLLLADD